MLKGAIIGIDPANLVAKVIIFQYNPDTMTRRLDLRGAGCASGNSSEVFRLNRPPKEKITLTVEVTSADHRGKGTGGVAVRAC